jgi:hypothetical protein
MCMVQTAHGVTWPPDSLTTEYLICAWPSPVFCTRSPTPVIILVTARHVAPATCTPRDKQTRFSTWNKTKGKTTEMSRIRIQTPAYQWLITIKQRNWPLGFSSILTLALSWKKTEWSAWLVQRSKPQHLMTLHAMCHMTEEHLAWLDLRETQVSTGTRYPCNLCGSRTLNVWSGEPRLYAVRPWHWDLVTLGTNPLLNKPSDVLIQIIKDFECSMNSVHDAHSPEHKVGNYPVWKSRQLEWSGAYDSYARWLWMSGSKSLCRHYVQASILAKPSSIYDIWPKTLDQHVLKFVIQANHELFYFWFNFKRIQTCFNSKADFPS